MNIIIYIMKNLKHKNDKFFQFFINYQSDIDVTDIEFFNYYITNFHLFDNYYDNPSHIINIYNKAKFIKNSFKKLIQIWKLKKCIKYDNQCDLYFNPLSDLKHYLKVNIIQNNTLYSFRISDIINLWVTALTTSENLFCKPTELKNPFTNLIFKKHNLYILYFSIYYSSFNVPEVIYRFFKCNMTIELYMLTYYPIMKEYAIDTFFESSTISEQYEFIYNMITQMNDDVDPNYPNSNFFFIPENPSYNRKKYYIRQLKHILKYYLRGSYSCNPLRKRVAFDRYLTLTRLYDKNNPNVISRNPTIRSSYQSPLTELPLLPNLANLSPQTNHSTHFDYSEIATSPSSSPDNTRVWPQTQINNLLSLPNTTQIEINIPNIPIPSDENDHYINNDDIVLSDIDSDDLPDYDLSYNNPFTTNIQLPRTPPNSNNTGSYYNSFQLFPNNNHK